MTGSPRSGSPTLLLAGSATEAHHTEAIRALDAVLPDSEVSVLEGQGHLALLLAPDEVTAAGVPFLDRH